MPENFFYRVKARRSKYLPCKIEEIKTALELSDVNVIKEKSMTDETNCPFCYAFKTDGEIKTQKEWEVFSWLRQYGEFELFRAPFMV